MNMIRRAVGPLRWLGAVAVLAIFTGCATPYVDGHLPEVPSAQMRVPAQPRDVQLLWEFQTRGVANPRATELLDARVRKQISDSGLFKTVSATPAPGGALLSISVNNVPLSDDAFSKGFVAGLTFGLAGQTVGDGYECTLRYTPAKDGTAAVTKTAKHVIYTRVGAGGGPEGAVKTDNIEAAVSLMLRQLLSHALDDLSRDASFP